MINLKKNQEFFLGLLGISLFLLLWQWIGSTRIINPLFISYPTEIFKAGYLIFSTGVIFKHILISGQEFLIGYILAVVVGISIGILVGWYKHFHGVLNPFITILYTTPRLTLLPLFILWFGIGIFPKILIVFLGAVFPILINTIMSIRSVDGEFIRVGRSFGANDFQLFKTIAIPYAMPSILAGFRLAIGRGLAGIIGAELYGSQGGIGYLLVLYGTTLQIDRFMVLVIVIVASGICLTQLVYLVEKRVGSWRSKE